MDPIARLARIPSRPPRTDVLAAGALLLWALLEALFAAGPGPLAARLGFALAVTVPLVVRRRAPFAVICIIAAVTIPRVLFANAPESGTVPFPSLLLMTFSVALYERTSIAAVAGGLIALGVMLTAVLSPAYNSGGSPTASNLAIFTFFVSGAWTAGWLVRRRAAQARLAMAESGELARSAVLEERARIARDLHDVVAHSVSIIAVQAGAAEQLLDRDPAAAREHLTAVRRTARETMNEMRRLLDVLREDEPSYVPQAGLSRLQDLLEETRDAGVPVELIENGPRPPLAAGVDLVAFRIVQESLTNVRKHAGPVPTRVSICYSAQALELEISNDRGAGAMSRKGDGLSGGGHGLIGMRERARLFGGSFEAGVRSEGGFRVHAVLPLEEVT